MAKKKLKMYRVVSHTIVENVDFVLGKSKASAVKKVQKDSEMYCCALMQKEKVHLVGEAVCIKKKQVNDMCQQLEDAGYCYI